VNVDKHFDHLLAQQRELIGDYFKQSGAAMPAAQAEKQAEKQADAEPGDPGEAGPVGGPGGAAEGAHVAADQPRVW
jgi:hypothetical protein